MPSPLYCLSLVELLPWQRGVHMTDQAAKRCFSPSWQIKTLVVACHCVGLQQNNLPWLKVCSFCHFITHGRERWEYLADSFLLTLVLPFNKFLLRWKPCMLLSHFHIWFTDRGCGSVLVSKWCYVIWSWQMGRHLRPDWVKKMVTSAVWHCTKICIILLWRDN